MHNLDGDCTFDSFKFNCLNYFTPLCAIMCATPNVASAIRPGADLDSAILLLSENLGTFTHRMEWLCFAYPPFDLADGLVLECRQEETSHDRPKHSHQGAKEPKSESHISGPRKATHKHTKR